MFKNYLIITVTLGITMLAPIANAQKKDPGQLAGQGFGYALSTQERCAGQPIRSPEADKLLQARLVNAISKQTGSNPDDIRMGLAAGAMQANFTKKPTKKDCKEADKIVNAGQKMS